MSLIFSFHGVITFLTIPFRTLKTNSKTHHLRRMTHSEKMREETVETATDVAYVETLGKEGEDRPVAIVTALDATGSRPDAWGKGHIQLYILCAIVYLCSTMNGESTLQSST
jgi:hypothetical protein